ncbi:MAG: AbrB/MazE/SpoVT family DNA-binding domain-containing protein [Candidatus Altiarchaeales archaeon HGW-Altiarchaeales-1]|nr:MAG: AbrB/MazE/SpoVT family DNA-binding domain-containing protein [Candidatus Altiarchaeales archaeon HGW-Altiarchaeales-2]PKP60287.1 MAG: AbrB/MazE/SpoVT family DNA-binding domain-containing protein [Candidatus Altiarchaeales archaeon HGW-Altiarchaeales-1]
MDVVVIPIGNLGWVRIPETVLEQCRIEQEVILNVKDDKVVIKPIRNEPRKGWKESFKKMAENKDDKLIIDDVIDSYLEEWEW